MTIHVETSDFSRFPNARAYAAYLGLTPSEHSSGKNVSLGRITKQGNSTIRTTLVESAQGLVRGNSRHDRLINLEELLTMPIVLLIVFTNAMNE